ncbi:MAG: DUF3347 domain-containing protein [Chitinophagaceae bacterium]
MKSIIATAIIICSCTLSVNAQKGMDSFSQLLASYFDIKDALVKTDGAAAAQKAGEFLKVINNIDRSALSEADHKTFMAVNEKLVSDAGHIAESRSISQQRDYFKTFSDMFSALAKAVKLSDKPVYQQYCPMKKAYWLSRETAIKNPYYGKAMLTCGKVSEIMQ